jgi:dTDP-4-dehydrorhamnose reductase
MNIVVLGANGMLGHKMFQVLRAQFSETVGTFRGEPQGMTRSFVKHYPPDAFCIGLDVMKTTDLQSFLNTLQPDYIVNCIGIIKQIPAAKEAIPSIMINSLLPHLLADWVGAWGGRLIHFSTDCVFSGKKGNYREDDLSDAEDLYGRTKYLGEVQRDNALILRTSIIGRELEGFHSLLEWFLTQKGRTVEGFVHAIYTGVTTIYLSQLVVRIINENPGLAGLFHVATDPISKYDLLNKIKQCYRLDVNIEPNYDFRCDRSLHSEAFLERTGWVIPDWDSLLADLAADPTAYSFWRQTCQANRFLMVKEF